MRVYKCSNCGRFCVVHTTLDDKHEPKRCPIEYAGMINFSKWELMDR